MLDSLITALRARASRRVLLVGEAPARGSVAALDLASRSGRRLRGLMEDGAPFDAVNLLSRGDDRWDPRVARARAWELLEEGRLANREVVLLGRKVARAFARLHPALDALAAAPPFSLATPAVPGPGGWAASMVWWAPHPSGRNRWWNAPASRAAGKAFFGLVLGRLEFPQRPELPAAAKGLLDLALDALGGATS